MNRDKIIELAREARLAEPTHPFNPWGASDDALERFAALIEREVRGDAEPVACIATNGALMWLKKPGVLYSKPVPLFMQPAPDVVRQLVEALQMVMDDPDALDGRPRTYECVQEALAAITKATGGSDD